MINRVQQLDYLRGLSALGIVIYHYSTWSSTINNSNNLLQRFGIYGVAIFYILSGITLYLVYNSKSFTFANLYSYAIKRFFRIMPLLWLAIFSTLIISSKKFSIYQIILNLSGIFGFIDPSAYIAGGSWSIGNEIVFYFIFPFLLYLSKRSTFISAIFFLAFFLIHITFSFHKIDPSLSFEENWSFYVNPLNQIFFFVAGVFLTKFLFNSKIPDIVYYLCLISAAIIFIFWKTSSKTSLIYGYDRIMFSFASILICFSILKLNISFSGITNKFLIYLGEVSYSIYLMHPIVWYVNKWIYTSLFKSQFDFVVLSIVSILFTFIISHITYNKFEVFWINFSKRILKSKM